ncbi:hypothetical protein EYR41_008719 [Orbilia oligospora]|uniref:Uncharacterized protein n=1 Tax=Orbilia oligospora TaxID=2813651 RepID=A0A7C8PS72_ORBOL|nr:hypothetical protein TWF751_002333 [Orbilia oligospora]TGJ67144.1 hypothetical protein EYR41_008719 [Orbilia oligospora]
MASSILDVKRHADRLVAEFKVGKELELRARTRRNSKLREQMTLDNLQYARYFCRGFKYKEIGIRGYRLSGSACQHTTLTFCGLDQLKNARTWIPWPRDLAPRHHASDNNVRLVKD